MAIPATKSELIDAISVNYRNLRVELVDISPKNAILKEMEGHAKGTSMSVHNLLSYLVGWGQLVLKWNRLKESRQPVDFPETGYRWNELGKLAQKFYADYEEENFADLLDRMDKTVADILGVIETNTNPELYEADWYNGWTKGRMIQLNTSSPYANARNRLRKWKKEKLRKSETYR